MANDTYFDKETTVEGELTTENVIVAGAFNGEIVAAGKVLLKQSARIEATINAKKLMVEEGAVFNGQITLQNGES